MLSSEVVSSSNVLQFWRVTLLGSLSAPEGMLKSPILVSASAVSCDSPWWMPKEIPPTVVAIAERMPLSGIRE